MLANDAGGIGLFRSEFLYLESSDYPTEEQQFAAYKRVLESMAGKKVIIRTLDIGADKQVNYFNLAKEENPALGYRAIRICLTRPEIFKTQLRALYRASTYGNLGIMFPMITSVSEVQQALDLCDQVKTELKADGIEYSDKVEIGIMIETPAAAIISDRLAPMVDFFSVGTNDLTQYTLACDRQNAAIEQFVDTHHEAILRLIEMSAKNAHANGAWIGICGELAADTSLTESFLRMGIDELSVSPSFVLKVRDAVRIERLEQQFDRSRVELLRGAELFDMLGQENAKCFRQLTLFIQAGSEQLEYHRTVTIPKLSAEVQRQNDPMAAQLLYGFEENLARFESRIHDLELSRTIALQSAPQMKLIQSGNSVMAQKIQSAVLNTVPVWKNQFAAAVGLTEQTAVYKTQREIDRVTNAMVRRNAEILRQSAAQTAAESRRSGIDTEALNKANDSLIRVIEETLQLNRESTMKHRQAEAELGRIEHQLKNALSQVR